MERDVYQRTGNVQDEQSVRPLLFDESAIAPLAYQFWLERGCPDGCPEEDWFRAERELAAVGRNQ